ncbi:MAG TPA: hypothetical protein VFL92_03745, partial [Sphingomonas sp.]|nr:hypothetical protein [Sphingomonas sp.]
MHQAGSSSAARIGRTRGPSLLVLAIACLAAPLAAQPPAQDKEPTQAVDPATDPSFDAALPPLESLQPPPATEPGPAPLAPAATTPPQPTTEQPAALPPLTPDSELAQPLQPLATFNPNPNTANAKAPTTATTRIRYTVKVEGLDKVGLTDEFRDHSALVKDGKKAANTAQVTARAEEDVQLAERILRSEGYYDGVASYTVAPVPGEKGLYVATISVTPGPRYDLGKIAIVGSPPEPTHLAREALPLKTGEPIRAIE